jgi:hypothetical protein
LLVNLERGERNATTKEKDMKTPLATPEILTTLDDLVEALDAGTDDVTDVEQIVKDDALFAERAHVFYRALWDEVQARDLAWLPSRALVELEREFVIRGRKDGDLVDDKAGDYFAAVKTVRDFIVWKQQQQAKLN